MTSVKLSAHFLTSEIVKEPRTETNEDAPTQLFRVNNTREFPSLLVSNELGSTTKKTDSCPPFWPFPFLA